LYLKQPPNPDFS